MVSLLSTTLTQYLCASYTSFSLKKLINKETHKILLSKVSNNTCWKANKILTTLSRAQIVDSYWLKTSLFATRGSYRQNNGLTVLHYTITLEQGF